MITLRIDNTQMKDEVLDLIFGVPDTDLEEGEHTCYVLSWGKRLAFFLSEYDREVYERNLTSERKRSYFSFTFGSTQELLEGVTLRTGTWRKLWSSS